MPVDGNECVVVGTPNIDVGKEPESDAVDRDHCRASADRLGVELDGSWKARSVTGERVDHGQPRDFVSSQQTQSPCGTYRFRLAVEAAEVDEIRLPSQGVHG